MYNMLRCDYLWILVGCGSRAHSGISVRCWNIFWRTWITLVISLFHSYETNTSSCEPRYLAAFVLQ